MKTIESAQAGVERIAGSVERVTFHNEDSGYCVLRVKVRGHRELVTVVGTLLVVVPGEYLEGRGGWVNDPQYGLQFKADQMRVVPPTSLEGIEKYLGSGLVKGIGPHFARKLVQAFGEGVFDVIEQEPERLLTLEGIGPRRRDRVLGAWAEQKAVRDIMVFLSAHGVGTGRAVRIYKTYGDAAVERVRENPYRLALDVHGIGFLTADALAQRLGIPRESMLRARAGVRHVLQEFAAEGDCAVARDALVEAAERLLEIPAPTVRQAIDLETAAENLVAEPIREVPCLFLAPLHRAEVGVVGNLARIVALAPTWGHIDPSKALPWVESRTGLALSPSQREAVATCVNSKVTVLTGGPGVGKTTVVRSILQILQARGLRIELCAPTGRAAKRLAETTGQAARTIHRLLEFDPSGQGFKRDAANPVDADFLVVDEASMVDVVLANQMLRAVADHAGLLLVGDVDQLPSVGPGAVLNDLIGSGVLNAVRLTEVFRQAASSRIVVNAHRINRGEMPERARADEGASDFYFIAAQTPEETLDKLLQVVTERIPRRFGLDPSRDVQVLTPMNRGGLGARSLNALLQERLNADAQPRVERFGWRFAPGDKLIQTVNNYDKDVFNGDIGLVARLLPEESSLVAQFDGREVEYDFSELDELALAYATTVHKSQGSEYPAVVIPLATQHYTLLARNLLYTAVTRGKQLVVLIGQPKAVGMAVKNARTRARLTNLAARLAARLAAQPGAGRGT